MESDGINHSVSNASGTDADDEDKVELLEEVSSKYTQGTYGWAYSLLRDHRRVQASHSGKMQVLFRILVAAQAAGESVIVFSQSIRTLNVIERILAAHNTWFSDRQPEKNEKGKKPGRRGARLSSLSPSAAGLSSSSSSSSSPAPKHTAEGSLKADQELRYLRIDGSTPSHTRHERIKNFNTGCYDVILVSTRVGGEGVNLTAGLASFCTMSAGTPPTTNKPCADPFDLGRPNQSTCTALLGGRRWNTRSLTSRCAKSRLR